MTERTYVPVDRDALIALRQRRAAAQAPTERQWMPVGVQPQTPPAPVADRVWYAVKPV